MKMRCCSPFNGLECLSAMMGTSNSFSAWLQYPDVNNRWQFPSGPDQKGLIPLEIILQHSCCYLQKVQILPDLHFVTFFY